MAEGIDFKSEIINDGLIDGALTGTPYRSNLRRIRLIEAYPSHACTVIYGETMPIGVQVANLADESAEPGEGTLLADLGKITDNFRSVTAQDPVTGKRWFIFDRLLINLEGFNYSRTRHIHLQRGIEPIELLFTVDTDQHSMHIQGANQINFFSPLTALRKGLEVIKIYGQKVES